MKRIEDMTEPELRDLMNRVARAVNRELPPGEPRSKFVVVVFDDPEIAQYVSSCDRASMIMAMRETADRLERKEDVRR